MRQVLAVCLAVLLPVSSADAQDRNGRDIYLQYCSGCHGRIAIGDAPVRDSIVDEAPDLTIIARRYSGVFPLVDVVRQVDGRVMMRGHGDPMPVFGPMLGGPSAVVDTADGSPIITKAAVLAVADYLESVQR